MESESREEKSEFAGTDREWLRLVKTIIAMANTRGGKIFIEQISEGSSEMLDSSRVDDKVNKYVSPRIANLRSEMDVTEGGKNYAAVLTVPDDLQGKPYIIRQEGQYVDNQNRHHYEFHQGQIWVRHSAANAPAQPSDIEEIFRDRTANLLKQLGTMVLQTPLAVLEGLESGLPFRVSDEPGAVAVQFVEPYTAKSLGSAVNKNRNWIAKAANKLGWRNEDKPDHRYMQAIPSAEGDRVQQWRYSETARQELESKLLQNPDFDPYHDL